MVNRINRSNNYNNAINRASVGNGCNCATPAPRSNNCYNKEIKALIKKLQAVDFSMVDTILYLDVYPHCQKAMSYYHELHHQRDKLIEKLSELGVSMNNMSVHSDNWNWTDAPWPWELDANI